MRAAYYCSITYSILIDTCSMDKLSIWLFQLREKKCITVMYQRGMQASTEAAAGWNLGKDLDLSFKVTRELSQEKKTFCLSC